jgi:eukaryotic-like serine/threonine-protein kinase
MGESSEQERTPADPCRTVGPYRLLAVLGSGGMGIVYSAEHRVSGRKVALKTVRGPTPDALAGIRLEIATLSRLRHPGVVEIVDQGMSAAGPWYAMELLEGETLADRNRSIWPRCAPEISTPRAAHGPASADPATRTLPRTRTRSLAAGGRLPEILAIYRRLCGPLAFLHSMGIVHRDLKPANAFLRRGDEPVLMDFGLVGRETLEGTRGIRGTLSYLAPEICDGELPDTRADLYALGCMLWESLTGWPPFEAATAAELLGLHLRADPGKPSDIVSGVPAGLDQLVVRLLAKRPRDRLDHVDDVAQALAEIAGSAGQDSGAQFSRAGHLFRPRLVGRETALADLLACGARARAGMGTLAFVAGESGIGKTFLAAEVAQRASLEGLRIVTGECVPMAASEAAFADHTGSPLHPFRQLLQAMGDRCRQLGAPETERLLGHDLKLLLPYEPGLGELEGADRAAEPAVLPAEAARERLLATLRRMLLAFVGDCPTLLVLDDLQWADDLSRAFLASLDEPLFASTPLVILGTYRTEEAGAELAGLTARPWVAHVRLQRLSEADVGNLVAQMLAVSPPPQALVQFVQQHAEGIPFFVAEYLRAAMAQGVLSRRAGRWCLGSTKEEGGAPFTNVSFPQSLAGLVRLRLSRLTMPAATAAEAAAVLGRQFETWTLSATTGLRPSALAEILLELVARQVVEGAGPERYRFLHDKIRQEAYAGIDPDRRRGLHLQVTRVLEAGLAGSPVGGEPYAELAYHFMAAELPLQAIEYLARAGERALAVSAHRDAARYFREALDLEEKLPARLPPLQRATWERQLGDALQGLGRLSESVGPLTRAAAGLGWPLPRGTAGIIAHTVGGLLRQALHRHFPRRFIGRRTQDSPQILEAGRIFDRLMRVYYYTGQYLELLFANLRTLNLGELAVPSSELAMGYASAAATAIMIPVRKLARTYFQLALATLEKARDPAVESHVQMLVGLYHTCLGERAQALEHLQLAIALAEQAGFARRRDESLSIVAGVELTAGRHLEALRAIDLMEASAERRGDHHMLSWALLQRAEATVLQGELGRSHRLLRRVEALLGEVGRPEALRTHAQLALVLFREGNLGAAGDHADQALELASHGHPIQAASVNACARLAEVQLELLRERPEPERQRAADRACRLLFRATGAFPVMVPMAALHLGTRAWLAGKRTEAARTWRRGLDRARSLDNRYAEGRLSLALAATLPTPCADRLALESAARDRFHGLAIAEPVAQVAE